MVKHGRIFDQIAHKHPLIWIPHWEMNFLLSELSVNNLEARILIFDHHEGIGPQLNQVKKELLYFVPSFLHIFRVELMFDAFAPLSLKELEKYRGKRFSADIFVKKKVSIL